jgi:hypothetical protein
MPWLQGDALSEYLANKKNPKIIRKAPAKVSKREHAFISKKGQQIFLKTALIACLGLLVCYAGWFIYSSTAVEKMDRPNSIATISKAFPLKGSVIDTVKKRTVSSDINIVLRDTNSKKVSEAINNIINKNVCDTSMKSKTLLLKKPEVVVPINALDHDNTVAIRQTVKSIKHNKSLFRKLED